MARVTGVVHPLFLTEGVDVTIERKQEMAVHPARCDASGPDTAHPTEPVAYHITLFLKKVQELYDGAWVKEVCSFEEFTLAIELHEIAHVRYQTFAYGQTLAEQDIHFSHELFDLLDNILEDSRIEFHLAQEFPAFAWYLRLGLGAVQAGLDTSTVRAQEPGTLALLNQRLKQLFYLARFGILSPDMDPGYRDFILPLLLTTTRGTRPNALVAAKGVYYYLVHTLRADTAFQHTIKRARREDASLDRMTLRADVLDGVQSAPSVLYALAREALTSLAPSHGPHAGEGARPLVIEEAQNTFVERVCEQHREALRAMHASFRLLFSGLTWQSAYDGELPPARQMQAYLSAMLGEERADYALLTHGHPASDIVLIGDVSGSTRAMQEPYAATKVLLLAALDGIAGIYPSALDFSDSAGWVCRPGESLRLSRMGPRCEGGTQPLKALDLLEQEMVWRGRQHLAFWITDGDWARADEALARIEHLYQTTGLVTTIIHCESETGSLLELRQTTAYGATFAHPLWYCTLETLPAVVYQVIATLRREAYLV